MTDKSSPHIVTTITTGCRSNLEVEQTVSGCLGKCYPGNLG